MTNNHNKTLFLALLTGVPLAILTLLVGIITENQITITTGLISLGLIAGLSLILYDDEL